jgi:hypothetical protein
MKLSKRSASEKIDACVALSMAALAATKGGPGAGSFYCAAANLSPTATRITLNSSADDEAAGYAAEQRRWELEARGREFGADDGPDFVGVYGSGRRFEPF